MQQGLIHRPASTVAKSGAHLFIISVIIIIYPRIGKRWREVWRVRTIAYLLDTLLYSIHYTVQIRILGCSVFWDREVRVYIQCLLLYSFYMSYSAYTPRQYIEWPTNSVPALQDINYVLFISNKSCIMSGWRRRRCALCYISENFKRKLSTGRVVETRLREQKGSRDLQQERD